MSVCHVTSTKDDSVTAYVVMAPFASDMLCGALRMAYPTGELIEPFTTHLAALDVIDRTPLRR